MKIVTMILLSLFTDGHLYAQQNVEADVKEIRDLYNRAQEFVKRDKEDPTIEYQLMLSLRRHHTVEGHVVYDYHTTLPERISRMDENCSRQSRQS